MEREEFGALWDQLKIHLLSRWNKLTGEDLKEINGSYDLFVAKVEEKYGVSRGEVEEEFRNWTPPLEIEDIPVRETESQREDFPAKKWVIAGILLAALLGYLAMYNTPKSLENNSPKVETRDSSKTSIK
ncbi:MAG: hypothetical protein H0T62_01625 [Parachlamydiaceae bacterium]|nr:hypothetical protein [Parachlamydiaceae bacterium]